jgi:hypothetical protein
MSWLNVKARGEPSIDHALAIERHDERLHPVILLQNFHAGVAARLSTAMRPN